MWVDAGMKRSPLLVPQTHVPFGCRRSCDQSALLSGCALNCNHCCCSAAGTPQQAQGATVHPRRSAAAVQLLLLSYRVYSGPVVSAGLPALRSSTSLATASLGGRPPAPNHFCSSS